MQERKHVYVTVNIYNEMYQTKKIHFWGNLRFSN